MISSSIRNWSFHAILVLAVGAWLANSGFSPPANAALAGINRLGISPDGTAAFRWDSNPEPDLAGYKLYIGTLPGVYSEFIDVGMVAAFQLRGLVRGATYYFALTAYNTIGQESGFAPELVGEIPLLVPNLPPTLDAIPDMTFPEDSGPQVVALTGISSGGGNEVQTLTISAISSNPDLMPQPIVNYLNPGSSALLTLQPYANLSGTALITVTVDDGELTNGRSSQSFTVTVRPVNDPPQISAIPPQQLLEDTASGLISFAVMDLETPASSLVVNASSSNPSLIGPAQIDLNGTETNRSIRVQPLPNQFGTTEITIQVRDSEGAIAESRFTLAVHPVDDPPQISPVPPHHLLEDAVSQTIAFTVTDLETPASGLAISASSSNPSLIDPAQIAFAGTSTNRAITLQPMPNQSGIADITIRVRDPEGAAAETTFTVTVDPMNDPPQISQILDLLLLRNRPSNPIPFMIGDLESTPSSLDISVSSSNPQVIPLNGFIIGGSSNDRTLLIDPTNGRVGVSIITITISDGSSTTSMSFQVTVVHADSG